MKCKIYMKNFGEFFRNQVEAASTVILSRTDTPKATDEKVKEVLEMIRVLNPDATVITTPVEELGGRKVLETMEGVKIDLSHVEEEEEHHHHGGGCGHEHHHGHEEECGHEHHHGHEEECGHEHHHDHGEECGHEHHHDHGEECGHDHHHGHEEECGHEHHHDHENCCGHDHGHHHHHADEVFTSWGKETVHKYEKDEMEGILHALSDDDSYGTILRAKGMVEGTDGKWIYFDMVPGEADVREGQPEYTGRICVIGAQLKEDKLEQLFML